MSAGWLVGGRWLLGFVSLARATTIPDTAGSGGASGATIPDKSRTISDENLPFCRPPVHETTPLHMASSCGWLHMVQLQLQTGAFVDARDSNERTPLMLAGSHATFDRYPDYRAVAFELLDYGAEVDKQDDVGWSTVHHAAMVEGRENRSILAVIVEQGADILLHDVYGWTPYTLSKYNHRVWNEQFLEARGGNPGYWARLHHAILDPEFLYCFYVGCGLALVYALLVLLAMRCDCTMHQAQEERRAPPGARLLAAATCMSNNNGLLWPLFLKLVFMGEVTMNMVFVFGYCMYRVRPQVMVPTWVLLWVLPSTAFYGIREVIANPALAVTSAGDPKMAILSVARWLGAACLVRYAKSIPFLKNEVLEFVFSASQYHADLNSDLVYWDANATLSFAFVEIHNINMHQMFEAYQMALLVLSAGAAFTLALTAWKRHGASRALKAEEVWQLAEAIAQARSLKQIAAAGVQPVVWYPRLADLDLGLLLHCAILAMDIFFFDAMVILDMVARQHYPFFACMLAIFLSSLFAELIVGKLRTFPQQWRDTLRQGYLTDGLLGITQREMGWESFAQLAFTAYALPFVSDSPRALLNLIFSMLLSVYGLAGHLFISIEYERATEEEAVPCKPPDAEDEEDDEEDPLTEATEEDGEEEEVEATAREDLHQRDAAAVAAPAETPVEVRVYRWLFKLLRLGHV